MDSPVKPQGRWIKELILGIAAIAAFVLAFSFWWRIMPVLMSGAAKGYLGIILPVALLTVSAVLLAFSAVFLGRAWTRYAVAAGGVGIPAFFLSASPETLLIFAASILFTLFASYRMRKEYLLSLGFSISKISKAGVPLYFTAAALIVSVFYLNHLDEKKAIAAFLPRSLLNLTLDALSPALQSFTGLATLSPEASIDAVLQGLVRETLKKQGVRLDQVPQKEFLRLLAVERDEIAAQYGLTLQGGERFGDVLHAIITEQLERLLGPYKKYLPFASAAAFFFAFKALTFPLYFIAVLLAFLLIKLLRVATIVKSERQSIEVEKLTF